jgi:hypothetical protein
LIVTDFQKSWLRIWAWVVVLFGAVLALFAFAATDGPTRLFMDLVIGRAFPEDVDDTVRFAMGLMGCVTMGWGLTFLVAFEAAHHLTGAAAAKFWRGIILAMAVWFAFDCAISIHTGFWRNCISNTVLAVLLLMPILQSCVLKDGKA